MAGVKPQKKRLEEIDTEEVSLVDRAANKKQFLVVKNDGGVEMADEKKQGEQTPETEVVETEKSEEVSNPEAASEPTDTPESEAGTETDDTTEVEVEKQADVSGMFKSIMTSLNNLTKMVQGLARQKYPKPAMKDTKVSKDASETEGAETTEEVEKAGAKISKKRLAMAVEAHKQLTSLLKDLGAIKEDTPVKKSDDGEPATEELDVAKQLDEITSQIGEVAKQVEGIIGESGQSQQPGNNATEEPVEKSKPFWGGVL